MLRLLLTYDPATGALYWRARKAWMFRPSANGKGRKSQQACADTWNARYAGKPALNTLRNGRLVGEIFDRPVKAHRAIWAIVFGFWPTRIDHKDGCPSNNRISNLRVATRPQNAWNSVARRGKKGAFLDKRRDTWFSSITVGGRSMYLGTFQTEEAAAARYDAAARELHGEFYRATASSRAP